MQYVFQTTRCLQSSECAASKALRLDVLLVGELSQLRGVSIHWREFSFMEWVIGGPGRLTFSLNTRIPHAVYMVQHIARLVPDLSSRRQGHGQRDLMTQSDPRSGPGRIR
jgi:hypothetical protein